MIKIFKTHYALPWFMKGNVIYYAFQQIKMNTNLKPVRAEPKKNEFAIRLNLN